MARARRAAQRSFDLQPTDAGQSCGVIPRLYFDRKGRLAASADRDLGWRHRTVDRVDGNRRPTTRIDIQSGDSPLISRCRAVALSAESSGSILIATLRPSMVSSARKTSPIPPEPSFRMIR
jgi:hypothetical protein